MQKRPIIQPTIQYDELTLDDDFPLCFFTYTQKYQSSDYLHFHNGLEIGLCCKGSGLFFVQNNIYSFKEGDVSVIFSDQPHIAQSSDEEPSHWVYIFFDVERMFCNSGIQTYLPLVNLLYQNSHIQSIINTDKNEDITALVKLMIEELNEKKDNYKDIVKSMLWAFLLKLSRLTKSSEFQEDMTETQRDYDIVSPAIQYISANYSENIRIEELAKMCYISPTHFRRLFKKIMKWTPFAYIFQVRIRMATTLLKSTKLSVAEIAFKVGYRTVSSFNRHFKEYMQLTPSEFKQKQE